MNRITDDRTRFHRFAAFVAILAGIIPGAQAAEVETMRDALRDPLQPEAASRDGLFKIGPVNLHPRAAASVVYDDNIFISDRDEEEDVIWAFSPGLTLAVGRYPTLNDPTPGDRYFSLDYNPTFIFFTDNDDENAIDHQLTLAGQYTWTKLSVGLQHSYQNLSGAESDVGDRVNRDIFNTRLTSHYQMTEKTSFNINGSYIIRDYRNQIDTTEWINDNWINYHIRPKITVGTGVTLGWVDQTVGPDQTYQQVLVRTTYDASAKVNFNAAAGVEFRQYEGSGEESNDTGFVFNLGAGYRPFDGTTLSLNAYRRDQNSVTLAGQNYVATGAAASIRQRFLSRYFFTLAGGYEQADYHSTLDTVASDREDEYFFVRSSVDWNFTQRWAAGVFHQYRENDSSGTGTFDFDNNQFGLQTSVRF